MADIALVHLGIDSSGVVAGEKQATASFNRLAAGLENLEKSIAGLSKKFGSDLKPKVEDTGKAAKDASGGIGQMGGALQGLGGPIGQATSGLGNLVSQASGLVGAFGGAAAGAVALVTAITALAATVVSFAREGVGLSDKLDDIAQALGFTHTQMERFNAAARVQGEDVAFLERTYAAFEGAIKESIDDPSSDAMRSLAGLRVNLINAAKDPQSEFLRLVGTFDRLTDTLEGSVAAHNTFGRGTNALKRISEEFRQQLSLTNEELESNLLTVGESTTAMARQVDVGFNTVLLQFDNLKRKLVVDLGPAFTDFAKTAGEALKDLLPTLRAVAFGVAAIAKPFAGAFKVETFQPQPTRGGAFLPGAAEASEKAVLELQKMNQNLVKIYGQPRVPGEAVFVPKLPKGKQPKEEQLPTLPAGAGLTFDQVLDLLGKGMKQVEENAQGVANGMAAINARLLEILGARAEWIRQGVPLPLPPGLIQTGGPGQPFPGAPEFFGLPSPKDIRTEEQARLDQQFEAIFDDFFVTILTAQNTLSGAFAGLALGIADTFAIELTKAMRESFITPLVRGMTELLQEGLASLFGGLKGFGGSGVKGVFGGILKGIGTIFGGLFATGGTLAPGKFGIAGERGPELLFSGNQPLHIAPVSNVGGSGVISVNMNFAIATPTGEVSQRTQDQIADSAMRGMERAQRLRGAR